MERDANYGLIGGLTLALPVRPEACSLVFWVDVMPHLGHTLSALQA